MDNRSIIVVLMFVLIVASCTPFNEDAVDFDMEVQAFGTEAADLRLVMQNNRIEVAQTVDASNAVASNFITYNDHLLATLAMVQTATPTPLGVFNDQGPLPPELFDLSDGVQRFVQIGTASQLDSEGCFISHQQYFTNPGVIYAVALALNLQAGTAVRADWQYGGEILHSTLWTAPQAVNWFCVSLALRPSNVAFTPGNWSVQLYINGQAAESKAFTITG